MTKTISWVAFILSIVALALSGWLLFRASDRNAMSAQQGSQQSVSTAANSKNGITISSPIDGQTVGRKFTLSGTGPTQYQGIAPSINIDGETLFYWDTTSRGSPSTTGEPNGTMQSDGSFELQMDLSGNEVVQDRSTTASAGTLSGLTAGTHTFTIKWDPRLLGTTEGPTLTLTVQ